MSQFGFPKSARLRKRAEFDRVLSEARGRGDARLVVHARPNGLGGTRLGIVVPKGVRSSVRRNRFKRLLREAFRMNRGRLPRGLDLVVIPRIDRESHRNEYAGSLIRLAAPAGPVKKPRADSK
ncbi:MAG: ribonuclease P protein component [Planctomycetes bacterium]|nr:ribonuclease P protein component [Planctomycetota bacterium]